MSIPQVATIYAQTERIFCPLRQQELLYLREQGQISDCMRVYIMEYLSRELQVECPIFVNDGTDSGVLHTVVKRPYRRYPSHVYLFAVLLWLIGLSMIIFNQGLSSICAENTRSEERRVGKECRSRWSPYH